MSGVLMLVLARARHRPGRWLLPALGIALAVAFAGTVWVQSEVAGTQAERQSLAAAGPLGRTVRVTWEGPVTPAARAQATGALRGLSPSPPTEVTLLDPVRLDGLIVRPAGVSPLAPWSTLPAPGPCRPARCPVLLSGGRLPATVLSTSGARLAVVGRARVSSPIPLGFVPEPCAPGEYPLLLTGDERGLDALDGLSGVYRTHNWVAVLQTRGVPAWALAALEHRLARAQATLLADSPQFTVSAPFATLDAARAAAAVAPSRLRLAGGGAVAALILFIVLSAAGLRSDQSRDLARLELAGARRRHGWLLVVLEAAWISGLAAACGTLLAVLAGVIVAHAGSVDGDGALLHSVLTARGAAALAGGWLASVALITAVVLAPGRALADVIAVAAVAALVAALTQGRQDSGSLALALAPLACLAAGVLVFRIAGWVAAAGERVLRGGPVLARLALIGLARAPQAPALAIAFVALSTGLGGFALVYRATLRASAADQAAQQVGLDATVAASSAFVRPLDVAPLGRWQQLAGGTVLAVRRTQATFTSAGATVTVPALGVPASALATLPGWRHTGASQPAAVLGRRLASGGPTRNPGPRLPPAAQRLAVAVDSRALDVDVAAELRTPAGAVAELDLGVASARRRVVSARLPAGRWELQAFELSEPTGLQITNDHQNGENPAARTQASVPITLGPVRVLGPAGATLREVALSGWRALGSAGADVPVGESLRFSMSESGLIALVRPPQPSDARPVPVLVDPVTAAAAARGGRLALQVDGQPVSARVAGVVQRFPTVATGSAGFVIADEATLAGALEAQLPGQGAPDELWLSSPHPATLRAALAGPPLSALTTTYRADVQRTLRDAPVARAVMGTLIGAAALAGGLAVLGLLVALTGALRDRALQDDLYAQGLGPRALRAETRLRLAFAAALGVAAGLLVSLALARLAVSVVRAAGVVAVPDPPLSAVSPAPLLLGWGLAALAALALAGWLATARVPHRWRR